MSPAPGGIDPQSYDAVLFDLDGVLTATAKIHAACWQEMFDDFLRKRAAERGEPVRPFDVSEDYLLYVDGKPRTAGVRDFLRSRDIELPEGSPEDSAAEETVHGLGRRKNRMVNEALAKRGVEAYAGSVRLVRHLRAAGLRTAVVSSSENCEVVLRAAGIVDLFDLWVDGGVARRLGLSGKPAPDTFIEAARQLGVSPERTVVVEDAISGVQAGHAGGFGLVIGVARHGDADELRGNGADFVVDDLGQLVP